LGKGQVYTIGIAWLGYLLAAGKYSRS